MVGRGSDLCSLSRRTGEEGTGWVLGLAGLDGSPWVVRVGKRCRCFVGGACRLGCFVGVADSCFVWRCCRRIVGIVVARIGCKVEVGLVIGREDFAGRRPMLEVGSWRRSSKEDLGKFGLVDRNYFEANCTGRRRMMGLVDRSYPVTACGGLGDRGDAHGARLEDLERTGSVAGRRNSARPESVVHKVMHLSRTGCPDHFVRNHCSLEDYRCSNVQGPPVLHAYAVHQQPQVVLRIGMTLVELERSSHHCCSSTHAALVAWPGVARPQIHADPALDMMLVELALNSHRWLSFARWRNTRSYCSDSAKSIRT